MALAPFEPAIQLLLLMGQRGNEVFSADRSEFDPKTGLWTIPGENLSGALLLSFGPLA